jgi:aspartyl protease family protein
MAAEMPRTLKIATVWLVAALALFLAVQWWERERLAMRFQTDGGVVELRRGSDGHYHWPGRVNGRAVDFLVDTGATGTAIPERLARELGLQALGEVRSTTANGTTTGRLVRADIELDGGVRALHLRVVALPGLAGRPLLGMDVLGRLRLSQQDGVLRIDLRGDG